MKVIRILFISLCAVVLAPCTALAQLEHGKATFQVDKLSLRVAVDSLMKWYDVSIVYLDSDVEG